MADAFDIMEVMVGLIASAVYPNGTASQSVTGSDVVCYPGWPSQATLDSDILATKSHVTVFSIPGGQNTTRYPQRRQRIGIAPPATLSWSVAGITATLSGTIMTPQNVAIIADNVAYTYSVLPGDTLASIATALTALIAADRACTSSGQVITIPGAITITARVGTVSNIGQELTRQKEVFQITVWTATPPNRKALLGAIRTAMAGTPRLVLPDGFGARIRYRNGTALDDAEKAILYRYDMYYDVEYATTASSTAPQAIAETVNVSGRVISPQTSPSISFNF